MAHHCNIVVKISSVQGAFKLTGAAGVLGVYLVCMITIKAIQLVLSVQLLHYSYHCLGKMLIITVLVVDVG